MLIKYVMLPLSYSQEDIDEIIAHLPENATDIEVISKNDFCQSCGGGGCGCVDCVDGTNVYDFVSYFVEE